MTEELEESRPARPSGPPPEPQEREKKGGGDEGPDPDAWMVTFSDLLTLLMTFFVLIFASQDPVPEKLKEAFGQTSGVFGLFRLSLFQDITVTARKDISQDRLKIFLDDIGATDIDLKQEERGLVIALPADTYFPPGRAELNARALKRIGQLAKYLQFSKHAIRVEGHTDNRETGAPGYTNSYDLSLARSHAVLTQLGANNVAANRMSLTAYGPLRPKFTNLSRAGRTRNRRVEIIILNRGEFP